MNTHCFKDPQAVPPKSAVNSASSIRDALEDCIHAHFEAPKAQVRSFCLRHFSLTGTLATQKKSLSELMKANVLLKEFLVSDPFAQKLPSPDVLTLDLKQYTMKRAQISDLASTASALMLTHFMFGGWSLDFFQMGHTLPRKWAKKDAVSHFFLGKSLCASFYCVALLHVNATQRRIATASIFPGITFMSLVNSIISDSLQLKLAIHERRLNDLLDTYRDALLKEVRNHHRSALSGEKLGLKLNKP